MSKNIVLLGLPGVGKGTQAAKIVETYNLPHISTGDMFREAMANETELGLKAKSYMDAGNLVPDEVTNGIVEERLAQDDTKNGFILDGYPRNIEQAEALEQMLAKQGRDINAVLYFTADNDVLVQRMMARGRADDTPEVIQNRLNVNGELTEPIAEFYADKGVLHKIDGAKDLDDVFTDVETVLDNLG
ncbi:adenylate kinase [Weissella viridescens]|uniref:Adenylate kinase n=1 Tax=Weissella viridescens TaxID=1629 RepID=A0A0R2H0A4_WEIVI|nr:adenylate kinase [Weissella viridescens]KRN46457.1 adenylate kinase [Weissella viridescens]MBX4173025.1 adenylate kinase [Weissella viridescens]MCB6840281.1 adenylate kinase [Weissella viridescens]MCB6847013.1 adenylate kinase [Weissella viridescens]QOD86226.1 adenylate kinase [Weissella viridescens]